MVSREPRRALAQMASGRGHLPGAHGLQWEDVAGALNHLRRPGPGGTPTGDTCAQLLVRYLWSDQVYLRPQLDAWMLADASKLAVRHSWRGPAGYLRRLVNTALEEKLHRDPCLTCAATGWVWYPAIKQDKPCRACGGVGGYAWPQRRRAAAIGVALSTYQRHWHERYLLVLDWLDERERRALATIRAVLRGDEESET